MKFNIISEPEQGFFSKLGSLLSRHLPLTLGIVCSLIMIGSLFALGASTAGLGFAALFSIAGIASIIETTVITFGVNSIIANLGIGFFIGAIGGKILDKIGGEENIVSPEIINGPINSSLPLLDPNDVKGIDEALKSRKAFRVKFNIASDLGRV